MVHLFGGIHGDEAPIDGDLLVFYFAFEFLHEVALPAQSVLEGFEVAFTARYFEVARALKYLAYTEVSPGQMRRYSTASTSTFPRFGYAARVHCNSIQQKGIQHLVGTNDAAALVEVLGQLGCLGGPVREGVGGEERPTELHIKRLYRRMDIRIPILQPVLALPQPSSHTEGGEFMPGNVSLFAPLCKGEIPVERPLNADFLMTKDAFNLK